MFGGRGFTKVELTVVLAALLVLLVIVYESLRSMRPQATAMSDGSQIRGVHQSWLIFAREFNGVFPVPGLIQRKPVEQDDVSTIIPGQGAEDASQNTTANLYSACIMQNYFSPVLCVGPTEPSGNVFVDADYNWDLYNPFANVHWDPAFAADLHAGSNVSYAHMPLFGERRTAQWKESLDERFAMVGNRGPKDGIDDPTSLTYLIHGDPSQWVGNVIFNDNHVITSSSFALHDGDNIFKMENGPGGADSFIGITKTMTPEGPVLDWD